MAQESIIPGKRKTRKYVIQICSVLRDDDVERLLGELHKNFVITLIDKACNNLSMIYEHKKLNEELYINKIF